MAVKLKSLDQVIGQRNIVRWFKTCIDNDRLPQVIMLCGPTGIGKSSIAEIVACEVACANSPSKLEDVKKAVIDENKSTDCVRVYNMSNLRSQEAVAEVKADLNVGFSSTGRKVIIMDEAHGMNDDAQDSLLTAFEALPANVYIIVCTTEIDSFRDAFMSRCVLRRLTNLSQNEMRQFLQRRIKENNLTFEVALPMVYTLISYYTGREPRRAINLLDSFPEGSRVSVNDLESFFNVYEGKQLITLIKYLYDGNILMGLEFINDIDLGSTFQSTLLEILKVAEGAQSSLFERDATIHIREIVNERGINNLLGFVIDCTTKSRLSRNNISGYFLKWCSKSNDILTPPEKLSADAVQIRNIADMSKMTQEEHESASKAGASGYMSLEMLMAGGETIED